MSSTPLSKMNKKQLYEECKKLKEDLGEEIDKNSQNCEAVWDLQQKNENLTEKIEQLKEYIEQLEMENGWGKTATLKYNEELHKNKKLEEEVKKLEEIIKSNHQYQEFCVDVNNEKDLKIKKLEHSYMKANLQLCDEIDTLKKENKKLKKENEKVKDWADEIILQISSCNEIEHLVEKGILTSVNCVVDPNFDFKQNQEV